VVIEVGLAPAAARHAKWLDWWVALKVVTYGRDIGAIDLFAPYKSTGIEGVFLALLQVGQEVLSPSLVNIFNAWLATDPYREGQISALDRAQKKAAKFTHHMKSPNWETLASCRKLSHIFVLLKAYSGEQAWKARGDRLQWPHYLNRVDHAQKIRSRRQRTDIGKYSFVNRTIQHWNQLPADMLKTLPCKQITFKKRVRKAIIKVS
jgi:hypothetical protein